MRRGPKVLAAIVIAAAGLVAYAPPARAQNAGQPAAGRTDGYWRAARARGRYALRSRTAVPPVFVWLNTRVKSVKFEERTLEEVIEWLKEEGRKHGINVVMDWRRFEDAAGDREMLIDFALEDVRMADVLALILLQAGVDVPLGYQGIGNILRIAPESVFNNQVITRVYEVSDVIFKVPDFEGAPELQLTSLQNTQAGGGGASGSTGSNLFQQSGGETDEDEDKQERLEALVELIRTTVEPSSWAENGGPGTISLYNDFIVVSNTVAVHEKIAGYVRAMGTAAR